MPSCVLKGLEKNRVPTKGTAAASGQRNLREELSFGDSDVGVRSNQDLFCLSNIGPALDDRGWKAGWNFRRKCLLDERNPARDVLRVIAEQDADGVFFLCNLSLQVRNLRIRSVEDLLCL